MVVKVVIVIGQYYQILSQNTVFLAVKGQNGTPVLKDLNRSRAWVINNYTEGYFEGYRVEGDRLIFVQSDIIGGKYHRRDYDRRPDIGLDQVISCEIEIKRFDLRKWSPGEA